MENFVQQFFFENINYESTQLSQQKAYACAEEGCSASYVYKKDLKNHIESKHKQMDCNIPAACAPTTHPTKAT